MQPESQSNSKRIYHITTRSEVEAARVGGSYTPRAFATEGFIHCSKREQVVPVAERLFAEARELVLLEIDRDALTAEVIEENLEGGSELFPHVYGPLPMAAVVAVHPFAADSAGRFRLPFDRER